MKSVWKNGWSAFAALIIFIVVEAIKMFANIPSQQEKDFETISNTAIIAVFITTFFSKKLDSLANGSSDFSSMLGSMTVPIIAFLMNITVFGHTIQWEQLSSDLWGWHLFWLVCTILQVLILLGLGRKLLQKISTFLGWMINIVSQVGKIIDDSLKVIQHSKKSLIWTVVFGIIGWVVDTSIQVFERGFFAVFSEMDIFWERVWRWILVTVILIFVIHILPLVFQKVKEAIQNMASKKVLVIVVAIILVILFGTISSLLKIIIFIIMLPAISVGLLWFIIKSIGKMGKSESLNVLGIGSTEDEGFTVKCWMIILLVYVGIPLTLICVATVLTPNGGHIVMTQDPSNLTTWLNLIKEVLEVAKSLLDLFAV